MPWQPMFFDIATYRDKTGKSERLIVAIRDHKLRRLFKPKCKIRYLERGFLVRIQAPPPMGA